jgi:HK97 family phage portal protein
MLLTTLFKRSIENPSTPLSAPDDWLGDALGSFKATSGVRVNRETALTYSAMWRGTTLISRDVGKLPLHVFRRDRERGGRSVAIDHPAYQLLRHKPNDAMTAMVFRQTLQGHAILDGNGYAFIWRNGAGEPIELSILSPRQVTPVRANGVLWYVYQFLDGSVRKIPYTDILHIKGFSFDGLLGYNLIHKARESLGWAMAMQTYGSTFFRNGARPSVILQTPNKLSTKGAANLRESWERMHSGLENSHRTAVLEEGLTAKTLSVDARDAQLIDQLKFTYVEVANWLGLPPHKVGGEGVTAYASLEQENQAYLDEGLDPWLVTWEEECRDKLMTEAEKACDSVYVLFDRRALVRADLTARAAFYTQMLSWGVYQPDEVREEEGLNPSPEGEGRGFFRPANMAWVPSADPHDEPGDEFDVPAADGQADGEPAAELLAVPDVRQLQNYDCGAAATCAVANYFGVGPATEPEWVRLLGTTPEDGTSAAAILTCLAELELFVTAGNGWGLDDLRRAFLSKRPVICCIQDYGPAAAAAKDQSGHWVVVIGVGLGQVFLQDPSASNVLGAANSDAAPGRVLVSADRFLEVWHDAGAGGQKFSRFGIAVGRDMNDPPPEQTSAPTPGPTTPALPAPTSKTPGDDDVDESVDPGERAAVLAAARALLADAVRRMTKRIGNQAERAATDRRKWAAWLDTGILDNLAVVTEATTPVERALASLGQGEAKVGDWIITTIRAAYREMETHCTPAALPARAAALAAELAGRLPGEAAEKFLKEARRNEK